MVSEIKTGLLISSIIVQQKRGFLVVQENLNNKRKSQGEETIRLKETRMENMIRVQVETPH